VRAQRTLSALVGLVLSVVTTHAVAQTGGYIRTQYAAPYVPLTGATVANFPTPDDDVLQVPLGFTFEYFGQTYTHVTISTNGALILASSCNSLLDCSLTFGTQCSNNRCVDYPNVGAGAGGLPATADPDRIIALWWDDLHLDGGQVRYATQGTAGQRSFVVEYSNVKHFPATTAATGTFQVRLEELTGAVTMHYGPYVSNTNGDSEWSGTMGIEDHTGGLGLVGEPCADVAPDFCPYTTLQSLTDQVIQFVIPVGPELTVNGAPPSGGAPGAAISVSVTARNLGNAPTGAGFDANVYFSTDGTIEASDTLLGTVSFANLGAGAAASQTLATTVPVVASGYYSIGAIVDPNDVVAETIETNNTSRFTDRFLVGLDFGASVSAPAETGPDQSLTVPVDLLNFGGEHPAVPYAIYFSADTTLDAQDRLVASATVAVPATPATRFDTTFTVPADITGGHFYVIVEVDPNDTIVEADETNNVGVSTTTIEVRLADIIARSLTVPGPFAFRAEVLEVSVDIENGGGADANGFSYAIYLSDNQLISAISDIELASFGPVSLAPGERRTFVHNVVVPAMLAVGPYYVGVITNTLSTVAEDNPNNNIARTMDPVQVRDPAADLAPTRVELPPLAAAGESMSIARMINNGGNADAAAEYEVVFSVDDTIDANDVRAGRRTVTVSAGTAHTRVDVFVVPSTLAPGPYYVGVVADPDDLVAELVESNNVAVSATTVEVLPSGLTILTDALPLATLAVEYDVVLAARGGTGPLMWSVADGALPTGLALDASGRLAGTPEVEGLFDVTVRVTDGVLIAERRYNLLVAPTAVEVSVITRALPPGFLGRPYRYPLTAFGGVPPFVWSEVGADGLPPGLTLDADGVISGTPGATALSNLVVRVEDATGGFAEAELALRVVTSQDTVRFSSELLPDGRIGSVYDETVRAAMGSGVSPFTFGLVSGTLPEGLLHERGRIYGTPSRVGEYSFTMRVTDGRGDFDVNRFVVTIREQDGVIFSTNGLPDAFVGEAYVEEDGAEVQIDVVAANAQARPTLSILSGNLPPGLAMDGLGKITGEPRSVGVFSFVVLAQDDLGQQSVRAFGISVSERITPTNGGGDDGCGCQASSGRGVAWAWLLLGALLLRRRRRWPWVLLMLLVTNEASAQAYFTETIAAPYVARSDLTQVTFPPPLYDDEEVIIPIPFAFTYFGGSYTQLRATTNGYITFGAGPVGFNNTLFPSSIAPDAVIAPIWDDLRATVIDFGVDGVAPNRVLVLQYTDAHVLGNATSGRPQVQLRLYEGREGRFEIHYGPVLSMTDPLAWSASIGFEDATGSNGATLAPCTPNCSGTDIAALENAFFRARLDVGPELVAAAVTAPDQVFEGVPFDVDVRINSLSSQVLGPFRYELHLVPEGSTQTGHVVYRSAPTTLAPFELGVRTATTAVPLPTPPGDYRLILVVDADDDVAEIDEANNTAVTLDAFTIASRRPDFEVVSIESTPTDAAPGETIDVTLRLANTGNIGQTTGWSVRLSENVVITADDLEIDAGTVMLDPSATATITRSITLPNDVRPGRYELGAIVDPANDHLEIDDLANTGVAAAPFTVRTGQLEVLTASLPRAYLGVDYTTFVFAAGGDGRFTWSVAGGALPDGLTLDAATGEISGRATMEVTSDVTLQVDSAGVSATRTFSLEVANPRAGIAIVTRDLLPGVVGAAYPPAPAGATSDQLQRIVAVGGTGGYQFSLVTTPPPGLEMDPSGLLTGVPRQDGIFELTVEVTDGTDTARADLVLTVGEPGRLTIVAALLPDGRLGDEYTYQLQVIGQTPTSSVTFTSPGPLPDGIVLSPGGRLVGIPQGVGTREFLVNAVENGAGATSDTATFRLTILHEGGFSITPSTLPLGVAGEPYSVELRTRSGEPPLTWRVLGPAFHQGVMWTVDPNAGAPILTIAGTPQQTGVVSVLVTVTDDRGRYAQAPFSLLVNAPPPVPPIEQGCRCVRGRGRGWTLLLLVLPLLFRRRV
jgi:MYXO-CTERM domain-containing protein